MINYSKASTVEELEMIISLQRDNLGVNLSKEEIQSQGFVTVIHGLTDLQQMNAIEQHLIAKDGEQVVAYLLAMTPASKMSIPVLIPMFELFDRVEYKGKTVGSQHYLVVGQVCVAKAYRGKGILDDCYNAYRNFYSPKYDFAITEIATLNQRSINAHARIGFKEIHRYTDPAGTHWSIVLWDW